MDIRNYTGSALELPIYLMKKYVQKMDRLPTDIFLGELVFSTIIPPLSYSNYRVKTEEGSVHIRRICGMNYHILSGVEDDYKAYVIEVEEEDDVYREKENGIEIGDIE